MSNLKERISAAAGRITKARPKKTPKVTGVNTERVSTEFGDYFKSPGTERYFAAKAMLDRLQDAFNAYDSGSIDRPKFLTELRSVADLHGESDTRGERIRMLADVMERGAPSLVLMAGVQDELRTRLLGLGGLLVVDAVRAPDSYTVQAPERDKEAPRPKRETVYEYNPHAGTARDPRSFGGL